MTKKMAISVPVPKDLRKIKTKVIFNLTKRQVSCFGMAGLLGIPLYLATKQGIGAEASAFLMVIVMLPWFFLAMYERDGFPAEKLVYFMIRQKFLLPGIRPYQSENWYRGMEEKEKMIKEVKQLERKEQTAREKKHYHQSKTTSKNQQKTKRKLITKRKG